MPGFWLHPICSAKYILKGIGPFSTIRLPLAILLVLFLVVSPAVAWSAAGVDSGSGSAVDIEGTTDDINIMCGDHKCDYYEYIVKYAAKQQDARGWPTVHHLQPSVDTAIDRLEKDNLFFFHGHCTAGRMGIAENLNQVLPPRWIFAKNGMGEKSLNDLSLINLDFVFFDCCESAGDDPQHGNLVTVAVNRGARCAFGFRKDIRRFDMSVVYGQTFWDSARKGASWPNAHEKALEVLKGNPRFMEQCNKFPDKPVCGYGTLRLFGRGKTGCDGVLVPDPEPNAATIQPVTIPQPTEPTNITLDQAQEIIRGFTGNPTLNTTYEKPDHDISPNLDKFVTDDAYYYVNFVTWRVQRAGHYSWHWLTPEPGTKEISLDEAYGIAEKFAKKQYPQLWEATDQNDVKLWRKFKEDHSLDSEKPCYEYLISFKDEYYNKDKNISEYNIIAGLKIIDLSVAPDGKIYNYYEHLTPRDESVSLKPDLTEEQAWEITEKYISSEEGTKSLYLVPNQRVHRTNNDEEAHGLLIEEVNNKQYLAWIFLLEDDMNATGYVEIDAHDGHIVDVFPVG